MISESLEFQICQLVDGTLPPAEREALLRQLDADPQARTLLAQHQRLQQGLGQLMALPAFDWTEVNAQLSGAIATAARPAAAWGWRRWAGGFAAAACAVLAGSLALHSFHAKQAAPEPVEVASRSPKILNITVGANPQPSGSGVEQITVGPSQALVAQGQTGRYADAVVVQPTRAVVTARADAKPPADAHLH